LPVKDPVTEAVRLRAHDIDFDLKRFDIKEKRFMLGHALMLI
jgi:hypothetical protein